MGRLVGLLSTGIVLAIEAATEHQSSSKNARKRRNPNYQQDSTYGSRDAHLQDNEDQRNTKAFQELQVYADFQNLLSKRVQDDIMRDKKHAPIDPEIIPKEQAFEDYFSHQPFIHPSLQQSYLLGRLPCPVIIPQRRPEDKSRGWVRAYAPALMECGIDQTTFLNFLDAFNESSKSSPHLDAVNVAALGAGFAPSISPVLISMAVPVAVRMAKTMQAETKNISFLTRANNELFIPRGLFAILMIYNPSSTSQINTVDTSQPTSYGTTYQEEIPPRAPLIFPDADPTPIAGQQNKFKKIGHFIADYSDRRAQAKYAFELLNSSLSNTSQTFRSLRGDTNNPANSGNPSSSMSGRPGREDRRQPQKGRRRKSGSSNKSSREAEESQNSKEDEGLIKRLDGMGMKKNVLYLIIVNNPTNNSEPSSFNNSSSTTAQTSYPFREAKRFKSPDFLESGVAWLASDRYSPSAGYQTAPGNRGRSPPPAYMSPRRGGGEGGEGSRYEKRAMGTDTADEYCVPTL